RAPGHGWRRQAGQARRWRVDVELRRAQGDAADLAAALHRYAARGARSRCRRSAVRLPRCRCAAMGAVVMRAPRLITLLGLAACGHSTPLEGETAEAAKQYP